MSNEYGSGGRGTPAIYLSAHLPLSSHLLWAMHLKAQLQVPAAETQRRLSRDTTKTTWKGSLKSSSVTKHTGLVSPSCHC